MGGYERGRSKTFTKESSTWSEFVKYWPIITITHRSEAVEIGLGRDTESLSKPKKRNETMRGEGHAEVYKHTKELRSR